MKPLKTLGGLVPLVMGFLVLALLASCDLGTPPQTSGGGGTEVEGVIVDQRGLPVAGVWVRVYPDSSSIVLGKTEGLAKQSESFVAIRDSAQTNANGTFRLPNLPSGTYNLVATVKRNDTTLALFRRSIVVNGNVNLGTDTLRVAGSLNFQVVLDGAAVGGALCYLPGSPYLAVTGSSGSCTLTALPPGVYQVSVTALGLANGQSGDIAVISLQVTTGGTLNLLQFITNPPTSNDSLWSVRMDSIPTYFIGVGATSGFMDSIQFTGLREVSLAASWDAGASSRIRNFHPGDPAFYPQARVSQTLSTPMWGSNPNGTPWSGASARATDSRGMTTHYDSSSSWKNIHHLASKYRRAAIVLNFPDSLSSVAGPAKWSVKITRIVVRKNGTIVLDSTRAGGFAPLRPHAFVLEYLNPLANDSIQVSALGDALETVNGILFDGSMRLLPGAPSYNDLVMNWVGLTGVVTAPAAPVLSLPALGATVTDAENLKWRKVSGATTYHLQVSLDSTFTATTSFKANDSALSDTARAFSVPATAAYFWRVRARNTTGFGAWSVVWKFAGVKSPSGGDCVLGAAQPPVLQTPANGAVNVALPAALAWDSACGALGYKVQVATDSSFAAIAFTDSTLAVGRSAALSAGTRYYWRVASKLTLGWSGWSAIRRFNTAADTGTILAAPAPLTPSQFATSVSTLPTLAWTAVSSATKYYFQISTTSSFTSIVSGDSVTGTTYTKTGAGLSVNTDYYWRVKAISGSGSSAYSSVFRFTTGTASDSGVSLTAPTLLAPAALATGVSVTPTLSWNPVTGAAQFGLQVSTSAAFSTFAYNGNDTVGTLSKTLPALAYNTIYYWRVRARSGSSYSAYSEVRSFTTVTAVPLPSVPALISPVSDTTGVSLSVSLVWSASTGASIYRVQVSLDSTFSTFTVNDSVTTTLKSLTGLINNTVYYWRVTAGNSAGMVTSARRKFRTVTSGATTAWTSQASGTTSNLHSVVWTGSLYVAVGGNGTIRTSPDGVTWTGRTSGTTANLNAVAWTGSLLVASGAMEYDGGAGNYGTFYTSTDGISWTRRRVEGSTLGDVNFLTWSGTEMLAGCAGGGIWASNDGISWGNGEDFVGGASWLSGAYLGNKRAMVAGNGINNTPAIDVTMNTIGTNLQYAGTRSSSGTTYQMGFPNDGIYGGLTSLTANGSVFVGVAGGADALNAPAPTQGTIVTSTDGTTWVTRATGTGMNMVTYTGGKLAAMSTVGKIQTSSNDGVTWTEAVTGTSSGLGSLVLGGGKWVAVGAGGKILTAPAP